MKRWHRWLSLLEYTLFRLIACVLGALPARTAVRLAEGLAFLVHRFLPKKLNRYNVAQENLRTAFGDRYSDDQLDKLIYRMWVHRAAAERQYGAFPEIVETLHRK